MQINYNTAALRCLGKAFAPPPEFQITICLWLASSPATGDCSRRVARGPAATRGGRAVLYMNLHRICILPSSTPGGLPLGHSSQPLQACNFPPLGFLTDLKEGSGAHLHENCRCKASGSCDVKPRIYTLSVYAAYMLHIIPYITYLNMHTRVLQLYTPPPPPLARRNY